MADWIANVRRPAHVAPSQAKLRTAPANPAHPSTQDVGVPLYLVGCRGALLIGLPFGSGLVAAGSPPLLIG